MASSVTSVVEEKEYRSKYEVGQTDGYRTLLPHDIFTDGERPLFESRSILWPLLVRPVVYMIIGLLILLFMNRIPLDSLTALLGEPTYETVIRTIIKWVGVAILVIGGFGIIVRWLYWRSNIYTATNRRILRQTGIIAKSYKDCTLNKIQTVHMQIPLLGRIFNWGTIKIYTAGTVSTEIHWKNLKNPKEAYRRLSEIIEEYRHNEL